MIWTNRIVLSAARFAPLVVIPIHMPNQHRARRFIALVATVATEVTATVSHSRPARPPEKGESFTVFVPTVEVTTTGPPLLVFVLTELVEATGVVGIAAIVRRMETWESPELISCKASIMETGIANVRSKA